MGKLLLLLLMMFLYPGLAQKDAPPFNRTRKGLDCESDMFKNITCTWDGMQQDTNLSVNPNCSIVCRRSNHKPCGKGKCDLGRDRRCTLLIVTNGFSIQPNPPSYNLNVMCENHTDSVAKLEDYTPRFERVRLPRPERPTIDNSTVSWTFVHCIENKCSYLRLTDLLFELQQKARGQAWKVVSTTKGSTSCLLDDQELVRGEQYWFRVRVKPNITHIIKADWSEWSAEATWNSTAGHLPATAQTGLPEEQVESWLIWWATVGALAVLLFLVGIMFLGTRILKASLIPTPSKYFDGLDSVYKGNFKAWLGSILTLDALGVEVLTEYTSPVEVIKKEHGKSCKSFSNKQYFQEEPQKTALLLPPPPLPFFEEESLEPCTEFSPYDDMGKDCAGLGVQGVDAGVDQDGCQSDITGSSVARRTITMDMTTTTSTTTTTTSSSSGKSSGISSTSESINTSTPTSSEKHSSISWTVANIGISCNASGSSSTSGGNVSISTGGGSSSCTANSSISYSRSSSPVSSASGGNVSRLNMDFGPIQVCNDYESFPRLLHGGPQSPDSGVCMSGEEESREEEEDSHDEKSPPGHHPHPGTFSFRSMKGPGRTDLSQSSLHPLVHPCTVPFSGTCGDPVGPNLCSTPTGWSPHQQNPLDMYGQLQPCSDDYQPLQAS